MKRDKNVYEIDTNYNHKFVYLNHDVVITFIHAKTIISWLRDDLDHASW